ncbi:MAG: hypothetical protein NVV74_10745 [Magnetospirillum sp.]|nr:hypothetical protein [Magnetospirillum sp.]
MKRLLLSLVAALAVGALSYAITRGIMRPAEEDPDTWLQREFKLTETQRAAVEKLQADYEPICAEHCAQIMQIQRQLAAAPDDPALQTELARLKQVCFDATSKHLREVAAQMEPAQARQFLALMEPKISGHDHAAPLGLK